MEGVLSALRLLNAVSDSVPVPGFKAAVAVTLQIAETVDQIKSNKEDCQKLAQHSAEIMYGIYEEMKHKDGPIPDSLQARIEDLESVLCDIEVYMERKARQRFWRRVIEKWRIEGDIQQFTMKLNDAVSSFQLKSLIDISHLTAQIRQEMDARFDSAHHQGAAILDMIKVTDQRVEELSSQTASYDGNLKLFVRDDFILQDELFVESKGDRKVPGKDSRIVDFTAQLRNENRLVVVKRFPRQDDAVFQSELEKLQDLWHPNIAQIVGCSRSKSGPSFIIKEYAGQFASDDLLDTLTGYRLIAFNVKVLGQIISLSRYLADLGYEWHRGTNNMLAPNIVNNAGHVTIDIDSWRNKEQIIIPYGLSGDVNVRNCNWSLTPLESQSLDSMFLSSLSSSPSRNLRNLQSLVKFWRCIFFITDRCDTFSPGMRTFSPGSLLAMPSDLASKTIDLSPGFNSISGTVASHFNEATDCSVFINHSWEIPTCESLTGWRRYEVDTSHLNPARELRVSIKFKRYTTKDTHSWLLENALSIASYHEVGADTLSVVRGSTIYIQTGLLRLDTNSCALGSQIPGTLYFFVRSHMFHNDCVDTRPWCYWSTGANDYVPVDAADLGTSEWRRENMMCYEWDGDDVIHWEQVVQGLRFYINLQGCFHYDNLDADEILLLKEVERWNDACNETGCGSTCP